MKYIFILFLVTFLCGCTKPSTRKEYPKDNIPVKVIFVPTDASDKDYENLINKLYE